MTKTRLISPVKVLRAANAVLSVASWWLFIGNSYNFNWIAGGMWFVLSFVFFGFWYLCHRVLG
jgi:hypothetical protein